MSATQTLHFVCDGCGKRADVEKEHPNQRAFPAGWASTNAPPWGDYCSEPCLRQALVAKAITDAAREFTPSEPVTEAPA